LSLLNTKDMIYDSSCEEGGRCVCSSFIISVSTAEVV